MTFLKPFPTQQTPWKGEPMQMTMFAPKSDWRPPTEPLSPAKILAVDLETRDEKLRSHGPGFKYGEGAPVGIAIATEQGAQYYPFAHLGGDNLDKTIVCRIIQSLINHADEVIMANATYDLGWLLELGIHVPCIVRDVQVAEALLDEERPTYSLDALSLSYLKRAKQEKLLLEAARHFEVNPKGGMWKLPARYVGTYGEFDALNTLEIYQHQVPLLKKEGLWRVWEIESKITKICTKMTSKGVPVDVAKADELNTRLTIRENALKKEFSFDIWSTPQVGRWIHEELGLPVPLTEKGNFSVTKDFLASSTNPQLQSLNELRSLERLRKVFIEDGILKGNHNGRIHSSFVQVARDDGGTRSGRFACRQPNLQQVPKRSELGKLIRTLYIAESEALWAKADYSSQEPRLQVHYALALDLPGAEEALESFIKGIKLYDFFAKATGFSYDVCKMLCLGIGYGMGAEKMSLTLDMSLEKAKRVKKDFNDKAPFISMLFDRCVKKAEERGVIKTLLGRRARFDFWSDHRDHDPVKGWSRASKHFGKTALTRAFTYKAMNRLIQGSAADQTKVAMVHCDEAGIDIRLPVHDEINAMTPDEREANLMKEIMENAMDLRVPSVSDLDIGRTWC